MTYAEQGSLDDDAKLADDDDELLELELELLLLGLQGLLGSAAPCFCSSSVLMLLDTSHKC